MLDHMELEKSVLVEFPDQGLRLFREMSLRFGRKAGKFAYPFVLRACGDLSFVEIGKRVRGQIVLSWLESDIYVGISLLAMHLRFGDIEDAARVVFDRMRERVLTSWSTVIFGLCNDWQSGRGFVGFPRWTISFLQ